MDSWELTLLVAVLPIAASLLTLWLSQRHARRMAASEREVRREENREQQVFQAREARHADRRTAVFDMIATATKEVDLIESFEQNSGGLSPGDMHDDYRFGDLNAAYAKLAVVATEEVAQLAQELREAVVGYFFGRQGGADNYHSALADFQRASRLMLAEGPGQ